jgi:hypothetical protein
MQAGYPGQPAAEALSVPVFRPIDQVIDQSLTDSFAERKSIYLP